jgi:glycosyltransferase involved in cell wall biosynthesis
MLARKVLQICHGYDPPFLDVGNQYASLFETMGSEVTTLYLSGPRTEAIEHATDANKVIFFELNSKTLRGLKLPVVGRLKNLLRSEHFDVVICHRYKSIYLTGLARIAVPDFIWLGIVHDFGVFSNLSRRLFLKLFGGRLHVLGVSRAISDDVSSDCPWLASERVFTLPNSIKVEKLQKLHLTKDAARIQLGLDRDKFIFGTAGRLHPVKDHATMLRAFAQAIAFLPKAQLAIMGSGKLEGELKKLAEDLGISNRVNFLGQVSSGPIYFRAFDVFVLPSVREPFGMVLLEAMAAHVPVISARTGGTGEIVGDAGLLFEPKQVDQLSKALQKAYSWSQEERQGIVMKALNRLYESFSLEAFRKRFWSLPFMEIN